MTTRRQVLCALAAAPLAKSAPAMPPLCVFSKHMARFGYEDLAKHAKQMGFDGVDLTVREKSHVLPERAQQDLPRAVDALHNAGLQVPMITTNLLRADEPSAKPVLSTAGQLKIPLYKPGYWRYKGADPEKTVAEVKQTLTGLVALGKEHNVVTGWHNHSGDYVGEAVWDTREMLAGLDPKWAGYYFDPAHATAEGGVYGWRNSMALAMKRLKMVAVKDFFWSRKDGRWQMQWCPLGEGMVDWPKVFATFAAAQFTGPISLHFEYPGGEELDQIAKDLAFLKKQVQAAYKA